LIDGTAYIHRAFHAIRGLSNSRGLPTNAVFGFTRTLVKLLQEKKPEYGAMVFDAKGKNFRHEAYPEYKANRPPMAHELAVQIPYIRELSEAFGFPVLEQEGYEADDVIATLADKARKQGFDVVVVSGDKDMNQLVDDNCVVYDPMADVVKDAAYIQEKTGVTPRELTDVMALMGDSSDNIPGVPGIGPKTAAALIQRFGSLEGVYEHLDEISAKKQRENLEAHREQAFLSRRLVSMAHDAPVAFNPEAFRLPKPDKPKLAALFKKLEFRQLYEEYSSPADLSHKQYEVALTREGVEKLARDLAEAGSFALDTETTSKDPMRADLVGLSFAWTDHKAYYVPVGHTYLGAPDHLDHQTALDILRPVLEDERIRKTGQNIKYDWIVLSRHGVELSGVEFDTMVASYLLNPGQRAHSLDQIAVDHLDHCMTAYHDVAGKGAKQVTFDKVPLEKAAPYACEDADITWMARRKLEPLLSENGLSDLFFSLEMPLVRVLKDMEMAGIRVDTDKLAKASAGFARKMEAIEKQIYTLAGEEFNIASPRQLGRVLFEKLKLPFGKKTKKKTGWSTDVEVLTSLALRHRIPALVLEYRGLAKLKSTYADALLALVHPETGRVHTSFNQDVTATGRLSSSDPNLQNIPIRTEEGRKIREAFVPEAGCVLISADYSQVELRILAHVSGDPLLLKLFREGEDIHTRTASEVFELDPGFVSPAMRRQAKAINFGIVYGMGPYKLSQEIGVTVATARRYIENYFHAYQGVKTFMDQAVERARAEGKTSTLAGRIRLLPDINAKNRVQREAAERTAKNTPIQGSAADLIKLAMLAIHRRLAEEGLKTRMLLSVHDELVFEAPEEEADQAEKLIREVMEGVWNLDVPLEVNIARGKSWAEAH
ncbi:MAG: DNA polymerase I, partial [Deltaproteobacteria bacterium]|nr:DNA polymerase I [Deltaproteobacteria bacterium]